MGAVNKTCNPFGVQCSKSVTFQGSYSIGLSIVVRSKFLTSRPDNLDLSLISKFMTSKVNSFNQGYWTIPLE